MKKHIRLAAFVVVGLLVAGLVAYRVWFHNPYPDKLYLDPASVFSEPASRNELMIRNATLIDVERGEAIPGAHLFVQGETIAEVVVGEQSEAAHGIEVYEAQGNYVMPGLIDLHAHLAIHPHLLTGEFTDRDSLATRAALEQFVRYGVTTVLVLGGGGANDEQAAELKRLEKENAIVAPLVFAAGDLITAPGSHPITTIMRLPADTDAERLHEAGVTVIGPDDDPAPVIARKKKLGLDGVKIVIESGPPPWFPNPHMSVETARKIVHVAQEHSLPVWAHAQSYGDFKDAVLAGVDAVMHGVFDTLIDDPSLIRRMKQEGIYYVPTLSLLHGYQTVEKLERLEDDFLQEGVSRRTLRALENPLLRFGLRSMLNGHDVAALLETSMRNLARLHEKGVKVALGSDASSPFVFAGYGAHVEMELMARAGLSNADILRIATVNGAEFPGIENQVGTLAPGKIANFVVLEENPLSDIRNTRTIKHVVLKGRVIDPRRRPLDSKGEAVEER